MIADKVMALMNGEIDGVNTPGESEWLQEHLASNSEARGYFEELRDSLRILEREAPVEPPPELRRRILAALAKAPAPVTAGDRPSLRLLRDAFGFRRQPSHAVAFAFGAALAAAILLVIGLPAALDRSEMDSLYGTALDRRDEAPVAVVTAEGVRCEVYAHRTGHNVVLTVSLASERPIRAVLEAEGSARCEGILAPAAPGADEIRVAGSRVELAHSGMGEYQIPYQEAGAEPLRCHIELYADGAVLAEQAFTAGRK
jgi:hypothetical protein